MDPNAALLEEEEEDDDFVPQRNQLIDFLLGLFILLIICQFQRRVTKKCLKMRARLRRMEKMVRKRGSARNHHRK